MATDYTWFSSVYYFLLVTYPLFYARLIGLRGRKPRLWLVAAIVCVLNYCVVAGWLLGWYDDRALVAGVPPRDADAVSPQGREPSHPMGPLPASHGA